MRAVFERRAFLPGVGILFLLSFALPALGDWRHFSRGALGFHVFCEALAAMGHLSGKEGQLVLSALSVLSNVFFVGGWVAAAARPKGSGRNNTAALMAWGLISLALSLLPLFCLEMKSLLIGYYLWVFAIGLLTAWWWYVGTVGISADRGQVADGTAV